jgi:hypothetical protein
MESNGPPYTLNFAGLNTLHASEVSGFETRSAGPTTHSYTMNLKRGNMFTPGPVQVIEDRSLASTKMVLGKVNWVELKLAFVPAKSEVLGGIVEILINGTIKRQFAVPRQFCATNGTFYATNAAAK